MNFRNRPGANFTRLRASILQEAGLLTVSISLVNHLETKESAWGQETTDSFEDASLMIAAVAEQFSISQPSISIRIAMENFKDGTFH